MCFARFNLFANSYIFMLTKWPARASPLFKLRILEFFGVIGFWTWFGLVVRGVEGTGSKIAFVLVSFAVTSPLHVQVRATLSSFDILSAITDPGRYYQIVLSHFSQPISITSDIVPHTELLESFAHRQLRTTMDIATPEYLDFLHGGLNFQVPHHLFPRMPRFRFRAAALVVKGWVEAEQLAYPQYQATFKGMGGEGKGKIAEGLIYKKMEFVEANRDVLGVLQSVAQQVKFMGIVAEADAKGEIEH
jgi:delta8-fatty-acid desaturase